MDVCPNCWEDLTGDPIPKKYIDKGYYGEEVTHYSKLIGFEIMGVYDGVLFWVCPFCNFAWPRFSDNFRGSKDYADKYNMDMENS